MEVSDVIAELDRQITKTLVHALTKRPHTVPVYLETAVKIRELDAAKAVWQHYGHRVGVPRLSKGAAVG